MDKLMRHGHYTKAREIVDLLPKAATEYEQSLGLVEKSNAGDPDAVEQLLYFRESYFDAALVTITAVSMQTLLARSGMTDDEAVDLVCDTARKMQQVMIKAVRRHNRKERITSWISRILRSWSGSSPKEERTQPTPSSTP